MTGPDDWAAPFEAERPRRVAMARRKLGTEDAVQEAWLRLARRRALTGAKGIGHLPGWLTTVTAPVCLDALRAKTSRREAPLDLAPEPAADQGSDLEKANSVGLTLLVVLEALAPAERVAFVLHDLRDLPVAEARHSPEAARASCSSSPSRAGGSRPSRPSPTRHA